MKSKPILAVTMGDPGGIGPEIVAQSLKTPEKYPGVVLLLIGAAPVFEFLEEELQLKLLLNPIPTLHQDFLRDDSVNFLDITEEAEWMLKNLSLKKAKDDSVFDLGQVSVRNAALALASLKAGAYQGATGLINALVTAPVNKEAMQLLEPKFTGHTEYLARVARTKEFAMMFLKEKDDTPALRVTLVTIHVPLKKVSRQITQKAVLEKIRLTNDFLKTRLQISKPKIGVATLNPHGKETGEEESQVIEPAINEARRRGLSVSGPISGDVIFYEASQGRLILLVGSTEENSQMAGGTGAVRTTISSRKFAGKQGKCLPYRHCHRDGADPPPPQTQGL